MYIFLKLLMLVVVDFVLPAINPTGLQDYKFEQNIIRIKDFLGRDVEERKNVPLLYIYDNGIFERKIILD